MPIKRVHCLCSSTHWDFVHFLLNFLQAAALRLVQVMSLCVVTLMSLQAVVPQWTNTGGTSLTLWHKYIRSLRKKEDQNDLNETWLSQTRFAVSSSLSTILVCTCTGVNVKIDSGFQAASRICPMSEKWKNNTGNREKPLVWLLIMHKDSFFGRLIPGSRMYSDHTNYKRY